MFFFRSVWESLRREWRGEALCPWVRRWPAILAVLMILGVVGNLLAGRKPNYYFDEGRPFTHLSTLHLGVTSFVAFSIHRLRRDAVAQMGSQVSVEHHAPPAMPRFWLLVGVGYAFLALDESAALHEKIGNWMAAQSGSDGSPVGQLFDGFVVLSYPVAAGLAMWYARGELLRFLSAWRPFAAAFILILLMIGLDMISEPDVFRSLWGGNRSYAKWATQWLGTLEDACKLMAVALMLMGFLRLRWQLITSPRGVASVA